MHRRGRRRLSVALVYPNAYGVGMANLGFQTVYRLLNEIDGVRCERVFLDQEGTDVRSLETGRRLAHFHIIAFSLSFELDYLNVAQMLVSADLPLRSSHRDGTSPLVMAGGVSVTLNPEPLAPLIDLFVIGESEEVLEAVIDCYEIHHRARSSRQETLLALAQIPGVYVPRFYAFEYVAGGILAKIEPIQRVPSRVRRQWLQEIDSVQTFSPIVSPQSHFRDMFLVEVGRGCPRGCRFCASGYIYRPFRCRSKEALISTIGEQGEGTKRIGLVGSAVSDHRGFEDLCVELVGRGYQLGVSSFRADALTPRLVETFVQGGMRTLTLAPETGSEWLRWRIHKNLTDEEILAAVRAASAGGMTNLKLYFMVGFPFAEEDEISAILSLVKRIHREFFAPKSKRGRVTVSVHPFVPKPSTPLQWSQMEEAGSLARQLARIESGLQKISRIKVTPKSPRRALLQGLFSVGDRRVGEAICHKVQDRIHWKRAWQKAGIEPEPYLYRQKAFEEILPWDVLDSGISKKALWNEYETMRTLAPQREASRL